MCPHNYQPGRPKLKSLIGSNRKVTIEKLAAMVTEDKAMSRWGKLGLCLIIIVDDVLVVRSKNLKPTLKYVKLVKDLDKFFKFQWERESFYGLLV